MATFIIQGGNPLQGEIEAAGSKNAVLPIIAATLLSNETSTLHGCPAISDVRTMVKIISHSGAVGNFANHGESLTIDPSHLTSSNIDNDEYARIRGGNLVLAPLLVRFGKVKCTRPGGDRIGLRSMAAHFDVFEQSGYNVETIQGTDEVLIQKKEDMTGQKRHIFLYETSVTATENAILLNVLGDGEVIIENAASEPHVRNLCQFLQLMGAQIHGIGSNRLHVVQVASLHGAEGSIIKDHVYIATFIVYTLLTGGDIRIHHVIPEDLRPILVVLKYFNTMWEFDGNTIHIRSEQDLKLNESFNIYANIGIYSDTWPKFPTDLLPIFIPLATQADGEFLFFEKLYNGRVRHADSLRNMGANVNVLDDHRVLVHGKTPLTGAELTCPDIRTGVMFLGAMLAATGKSILRSTEHINRGYPHIADILTKLGGDVTVYEDTF